VAYLRIYFFPLLAKVSTMTTLDNAVRHYNPETASCEARAKFASVDIRVLKYTDSHAGTVYRVWHKVGQTVKWLEFNDKGITATRDPARALLAFSRQIAAHC
jgi:hypothetical protein